jgi:hypothetical protein
MSDVLWKSKQDTTNGLVAELGLLTIQVYALFRLHEDLFRGH